LQVEENVENKNETKNDDSTEKKETSTSNKKSSSTNKKSSSTNIKPDTNTSNNNNNSSGSNSATTPAPKSTYASLSVSGTTANDDVKVSQSGNNFTLSGSIEEKEPVGNIKSGSYVRLKVTAPKVYPVETLKNASVTFLYNKITFTQAKNNFLENVSSTSKAYFYFNQEFKKGSEISIVVDWGDGNDITYKFKFDIDITEKNN